MKLTKTDRQFKQLAGFLGCLQGLGWFIMSLICIILFCSGNSRNFHQPNNYMDFLQQNIYYVFLAKVNLPYEGRFLSTTAFDVLMWPYLILDLIWFIVSAWLITTKIDNTITTLSKAWSVIVTIISIYDLFVTILLGVHYDKCLVDASIAKGEFCADVILPVLVIAAKGFVLWIVNVAVARILFVRIVKKAHAGTVYHENLTVNFQASCPGPAQPIANPLNVQNWENQIYRQQPPTPIDARPSFQELVPEHRITSPSIHNMDGERFQYNSRNASTSQNLNRNRFDHFDHYTSPSTNSSPTTPNAPNANSRQHAMLQRPNFSTNNGPQSENWLQHPVRLPRPDYDRAPVSLPSRY